MRGAHNPIEAVHSAEVQAQEDVHLRAKVMRDLEDGEDTYRRMLNNEEVMVQLPESLLVAKLERYAYLANDTLDRFCGVDVANGDAVSGIWFVVRCLVGMSCLQVSIEEGFVADNRAG